MSSAAKPDDRDVILRTLTAPKVMTHLSLVGQAPDIHSSARICVAACVADDISRRIQAAERVSIARRKGKENGGARVLVITDAEMALDMVGDSSFLSQSRRAQHGVGTVRRAPKNGEGEPADESQEMRKLKPVGKPPGKPEGKRPRDASPAPSAKRVKPAASASAASAAPVKTQAVAPKNPKKKPALIQSADD